MLFKASATVVHTIEFFEIASFTIEKMTDARNTRQVLNGPGWFGDVHWLVCFLVSCDPPVELVIA